MLSLSLSLFVNSFDSCGDDIVYSRKLSKLISLRAGALYLIGAGGACAGRTRAGVTEAKQITITARRPRYSRTKLKSLRATVHVLF